MSIRNPQPGNEPLPPGTALSPSRARASVADEPWVDALVKLIDEGNPLFLACRLLGMHVRTIQRLVLRDTELAAKLRAADGRRSQALWRDLRETQESYPGEWKKWAWQLEKTNPELRDAKDVNVLVDQALTAFLDRLEGLMPPESYGHLLDAVAELERQQAVAPPVLVVEVEGK